MQIQKTKHHRIQLLTRWETRYIRQSAAQSGKSPATKQMPSIAKTVNSKILNIKRPFMDQLWNKIRYSKYFDPNSSTIWDGLVAPIREHTGHAVWDYSYEKIQNNK